MHETQVGEVGRSINSLTGVSKFSVFRGSVTESALFRIFNTETDRYGRIPRLQYETGLLRSPFHVTNTDASRTGQNGPLNVRKAARYGQKYIPEVRKDGKLSKFKI